jgi:hypothetical protein
MTVDRTILAVAGTLFIGTAAAADQPADLREFRVGMAVSALPESGYVDFTCAAEPSKTLDDWRGFKACPAEANGSHAVSFRYDTNGAVGGDGDTRVGGQPVTLALLIDDQANVTGLRIATNPDTRLYLHKKAYLFGLQVRARYGEDGWTCRKAQPSATEQPVGGVFLKEHCEKTTATRHFILDRELYRDPAKSLRDYTDATRLTILSAG